MIYTYCVSEHAHGKTPMVHASFCLRRITMTETDSPKYTSYLLPPTANILIYIMYMIIYM